MKQTLFEQNGGTYTKQGDYLLPDVKLPNQSDLEIGPWGNRRRRYLKENHRVLYYNMMTQCRLYPQLADIEKQAQQMFDTPVDQMGKKEGTTEQLKAEDMMLWVRKMNSVRKQAKEIVNHEIIFN